VLDTSLFLVSNGFLHIEKRKRYIQIHVLKTTRMLTSEPHSSVIISGNHIYDHL